MSETIILELFNDTTHMYMGRSLRFNGARLKQTVCSYSSDSTVGDLIVTLPFINPDAVEHAIGYNTPLLPLQPDIPKLIPQSLVVPLNEGAITWNMNLSNNFPGFLAKKTPVTLQIRKDDGTLIAPAGVTFRVYITLEIELSV